jgi:dienelactone hydrolase
MLEVRTLFARAAPLVRWSVPRGEVRAVVLVLHGGKVRSMRTPREWQLAVIRMRPFARALRRAGRDDGVAVGRVLFRVRGWNRAETSPVRDVRAVLAGIGDRFGSVPVVLVGHSMGARAALRAADHPSVRAVVALAPWLEGADSVASLAGRELLVLHGDRDRWTSPRASLAFAHAARAIATRSVYLAIRGQGHGMLGRAALWHDLTTAFVLRALNSTSSGQSARIAAANKTLDAAEDGDELLTV